MALLWLEYQKSTICHVQIVMIGRASQTASSIRQPQASDSLGHLTASGIRQPQASENRAIQTAPRLSQNTARLSQNTARLNHNNVRLSQNTARLSQNTARLFSDHRRRFSNFENISFLDAKILENSGYIEIIIKLSRKHFL